MYEQLVAAQKYAQRMGYGYYDASKGYYVGAEGMSDFERTQQAIEYYRQNNMYEQLAGLKSTHNVGIIFLLHLWRMTT